VPNTAASLLVFAALAAPGLVFYLLRDSRRPAREKSNLRETASFVIVGLLCDILALGMFGAIRIGVAHHTPDVGQLIRHGLEYAQQNYAYLAEWSLLVLLLAVGFAILFAVVDDVPCLKRLLGPIVDESQWRTVFSTELIPGSFAHCRIWLDDGSQIEGIAERFSADTEETADRDLVLVEPIALRYPNDAKDVVYPASRVVISARRIVFFTVSYVDSKGDG